MSVEVRYRGRLGNKLFIYSIARLFAEQNGLQLTTRWSDASLAVAPPLKGAIYSSPTIVINDSNVRQVLLRPSDKARYVFDGYFQLHQVLDLARERVRAFFPLRQLKLNSSDIVLNVRLREYRKLGWSIHTSWYQSVLRQLSYRRAYVVTDEPSSSYFDELRDLNLQFFIAPPKEQFHFLRSFDRIVMSNSTFCWWAAFLSRATQLYVFKRWIGRPNYTDIGHIDRAVLIDGLFEREHQRLGC